MSKKYLIGRSALSATYVAVETNGTYGQTYHKANQEVDRINGIIEQINTIYELALKCGETFRYCRIGEDHEEAAKMRMELEKPYNTLAEAIEKAKALVEQ